MTLTAQRHTLAERLEAATSSPQPAYEASPRPGASAAEAESLAAWLGLLRTPELGVRGQLNLLGQYHTALAVHHASLTSLEACQIAAPAAQFIRSGQALEAGFAELEQVRAQAVEIITMHDARYPPRLREVYNPPILLYLRGAAEALTRDALAVVGTRHPTAYGRFMAERIGQGLAAWGLAVISGLARGIDGQAQKACVEAGGISIGVLGTGVDVAYPKENEALADKLLAAGGALISEFPLGTYPAAQNFPIRNRIISGLGLGVVVVEGGEYSGSRITARQALNQNRDVFAVPGLATNKQAWLPNDLIKQGAKLVTEITDIVDDLGSDVRRRLTEPLATPKPVAASKEREPAAHRQVLAALHVGETRQVDELGGALEGKMTTPELLAALLELELAGKIRQYPGKNYMRVA
ncbi:MAG: DNA-processing protein DprA [Terriglobales bacterium]